jgi:hypothetical protein
VFTLLAIGAITTAVIINASDVTTCVGGTFCAPSAWRAKDNTMITRVNDVTEIKIAGANESTVSNPRIFNAGTTCSGPCASAKLTDTVGIGMPCALAVVAHSTPTAMLTNATSPM